MFRKLFVSLPEHNKSDLLTVKNYSKTLANNQTVTLDGISNPSALIQILTKYEVYVTIISNFGTSPQNV